MDRKLEQWLLLKKERDLVAATTITDPYVDSHHDIFDEYRSEDDTMDEYYDEVLESGVDTREPQY